MAWIASNILSSILVYSLRTLIPYSLNVITSLLMLVILVTLIGWAVAQSTRQINDFVEADYASLVFRLQGFFVEPNLYAAFLTLVAAMLYAWNKVVRPRLYWTFMGMGGFSIYLTFTRVAWVAFAVVLTASLLRTLRRRPLLLSVAVVGLVFVFVFATMGNQQGQDSRSGDPLFDATVGRITGLFNTAQGTGYTRVLTIESALSDLTTTGAWWTGFGLNGYSQVHDTGVTSWAAPYLPTLWIAIFYDGGIVAGVSFVIAVTLFWLASRRSRGTIFFASFVLLAGATNNVWFAFPWVLGAIVVGAASYVTATEPPGQKRAAHSRSFALTTP